MKNGSVVFSIRLIGKMDQQRLFSAVLYGTNAWSTKYHTFFTVG